MGRGIGDLHSNRAGDNHLFGALIAERASGGWCPSHLPCRWDGFAARAGGRLVRHGHGEAAFDLLIGGGRVAGRVTRDPQLERAIRRR